MLKPKAGIDMKTFEKYGFKKCKGEYGKSNCYYLCVSRGIQMIFVSPLIVDVIEWTENDPRVHKHANCKYRERRLALDIIYELIKADLLISDSELSRGS